MLVIPRIEDAQKRLRKSYGPSVEARAEGRSIVLEGELSSWARKVEAGWAAARYGFKGVVNDIVVPGISEESLEASFAAPDGRARALEGAFFDVAIIGGGVVGAATARELSRWNLSVVLIEKEYDLATHTSGRNDGMIHDGFAAKPGSKKAAYNVRGNRLWEPLCRELGIEFKRPGSLVLFRGRASATAYPLMAARAKGNGVDGWEYWSRSRVRAEEPHACPEQRGAFFLPSAGVLSPYKATVALAENAVANGTTAALGCLVRGMELEGGRVAKLRTSAGDVRVGAVINAAGNWADAVAAMAGDRFFSLHQRRGSDLILDARAGEFLRHIVSMPSLLQVREKTKGGGLVVTPEGNVLVGPTARELPGREDYATDPAELRELERRLALNLKLSMSQVITYFAGVRPCTYEEDFIVERSERVANLAHAAGIQSPGLASAPAIAQDLAAMALEIVGGYKAVRPRADWRPHRAADRAQARLSLEERAAWIARDPAYGRVICRCEGVTEGEVRDALRGPLPVRDLDAVKRRTRAGMGRCHGGFCTPRVMELMAAETELRLYELDKKGPGSRLLAGPLRPAPRARQAGAPSSGSRSGSPSARGEGGGR